MQSVLEKFMEQGVTVRLTTSAIRDGESVGITGRIVGMDRDPVNPTVTIEWTSKKPHVSRTGQVTYGIRYIVSVQKWGDQGPAEPPVRPDFNHGLPGIY